MNLSIRKVQSGAVLFNVLLFSFSLTLVFTLVANLLPQVEGEAPVEVEIDLSAMTMDGFVSLGESIFSGKGTCTLCHNNMGRAPDILQLNMVATSTERMADERYKGAAASVEDYMRESMLDPSLYVVKGFGQKGSNDTVSPMPTANKAPILLTDVEMDAVIAFMQAKDGNDVTVALPEGLPEKSAEEQAGASAVAAVQGPAETAEEALGKFTCTACHAVAGSESMVGPELNAVGNRLDKDKIRESILNPEAVIAEGFDAGMMPADFAKKMTISELDMVTEYLLNQKGGQ
ncbi:MAG: c-type cytochrome [Gammaproteobacteria bacterium]|jgi:cytochrome c551/c552|nr:c-type cytochrome [Gammaproteobacteria bacterium]MBT3722093.1 c-type cytochrome [Gammaproteobacteria bacterium]MBT4075975.1 c-type cytochrome [Gammaproteobacteria bacterium]MBT4195985.1 c-type cytochrome [Gammaproteobacteria bacterium]MBT4451543.1 c-type cytochrome [Gammaproteobacteria bacterium]